MRFSENETICRSLDSESYKMKAKRKKLVMKCMKTLRGRYFSNKEDLKCKVLKKSIIYVTTQDWENEVVFVRCFICEDDNHKWWQIDEKQGLSDDAYSFDRVSEWEEIDVEEFERVRDEIVKEAEEYKRVQMFPARNGFNKKDFDMTDLEKQRERWSQTNRTTHKESENATV